LKKQTKSQQKIYILKTSSKNMGELSSLLESKIRERASEDGINFLLNRVGTFE